MARRAGGRRWFWRRESACAERWAWGESHKDLPRTPRIVPIVYRPVLPDDGDRHEHRDARVDGAERQRQRCAPSADPEGAQSPARRRRLYAQRTAADQNAADLRPDRGRHQRRPALVAYDRKTGKGVASADLPGIAVCMPMTYLVDGQQYIALTVRPPGADALPEPVALLLP